ncbi:coiled-coil domain-containing protein-domain-containing protein [Daldinia bambusicola]|nr:coiled-coil domain-containing protein-domain-containing protein [Daldinia bambusicola]
MSLSPNTAAAAEAASPMPPAAPPSPPVSSASSPAAPYIKPQPRPPRSPAHSAQIRVQNRRREYLERNPGYFASLEHELAGMVGAVYLSSPCSSPSSCTLPLLAASPPPPATTPFSFVNYSLICVASREIDRLTWGLDPVLYDALVRHFQSAEEREKEGREKGYSRVLEVDLLRGEAKLAHLTSSSSSSSPSSCQNPAFSTNQHPAQTSSSSSSSPFPPTSSPSWLPKPAAEDADPFIRATATGGDGFGGEKGALPRRPETREEGRERWDEFLRRRFVLGRDEDFDYAAVDENDELDVLERRELEDAWFDDEDPGWASDGVEGRGGAEGGMGGQGGSGGGDGGRIGGKRLEGETGIQDF